MAKINDYRRIIFHKAGGSIGKPSGLGEMILGYNEIGEYHKYLGVYQRRTNRGKTYTIKMKYVVPFDPRTLRQQANRYRYKSFSLSYKYLDSVTLQKLKDLCTNTRLNTQNMYLKICISQKPTTTGAFLLGENFIGDLTIK